MADRWHTSTSELRSKTLAFEWIVKDFKNAILVDASQQLQSTTFSFSIERCLVGSWTAGLYRSVDKPPEYGDATISCQLGIAKSNEHSR